VLCSGLLSVVEELWFVRFGRDLLLGLGLLELCLRHFWLMSPRFLVGVVWMGMCVSVRLYLARVDGQVLTVL
jgi:hypothetical protein